MAHGDALEGKWRGNWRMQRLASTLHTTSEHGVSSITMADAHTSAASSRLNWRPLAQLNGLVRFAERQNLVYACVPSHFKSILQQTPKFKNKFISWRQISALSSCLQDALIQQCEWIQKLNVLNLMFIEPCISVIVENKRPTRCHLLFLFHFLCAQHVSDINLLAQELFF